MPIEHRSDFMDYLQEHYGLNRGDAGAVADFAHASGACFIPGTSIIAEYMTGYGYSIRSY